MIGPNGETFLRNSRLEGVTNRTDSSGLHIVEMNLIQFILKICKSILTLGSVFPGNGRNDEEVRQKVSLPILSTVTMVKIGKHR